MGRSPCCSKEGLNRGAWTAIEDKILSEYIKLHGEGKWRNLPKRAGLKRCGKSCRLRWLNYLRPDIKRGNITHDEEELIVRLHNLLGNRWSLIAGRLPGRTDNEIKNYWNTNIGKRIQSSPKTTCRLTPPKPTNYNNNNNNNSTEPAPQAASPKCSPVVRTRATRCTKVLLPPPIIPHVIGSTNPINPTVVNEPLSVPKSDGRDRIMNTPKDHFLTDDDDDRHVSLLSDFLNVDCFDDIVVTSTSTAGLDDVTNIGSLDHNRKLCHVIEPAGPLSSSSRSSNEHDFDIGGEAFLFSQDDLLSSLIQVPELDWFQH